VAPEELADETLRSAVAIDVGGVEERDAGLDGALEHLPRLLLAHLAPVGAELPATQADDGDGKVGATQDTCLHAAHVTAVTTAFEVGYRHIDTAQMSQN